MFPYTYSRSPWNAHETAASLPGRLTELSQLLFCSILHSPSSVKNGCVGTSDSIDSTATALPSWKLSIHSEGTTILQRLHNYHASLVYSQQISVQLHAVNALLIYLLLRKYLMTQRPYSYSLSNSCATLLAIIFAVHPCHKPLVTSGCVSILLSLSLTLLGLLPYLSLLSTSSSINGNRSHTRITLQNFVIVIFQMCSSILCFSLAIVYNVESLGIQAIILLAIITGSTVVYISSKALYIPALLCPLLVFTIYSILFYSQSDIFDSSSSATAPLSSSLILNSIRHTTTSLANYLNDQPPSTIFLKTAHRMSLVVKKFFRLRCGYGTSSIQAPLVLTEMDMSTIYELAGVVTLLVSVALRLTSTTVFNIFRFQKQKVSSFTLLIFSLFALCLVQDMGLSVSNMSALNIPKSNLNLESCSTSAEGDDNSSTWYSPETAEYSATTCTHIISSSSDSSSSNTMISGVNHLSPTPFSVCTYFPHAFIALYAGTGLADAWVSSTLYGKEGQSKTLAIKIAYIFLVVSAALLTLQTMHLH